MDSRSRKRHSAIQGPMLNKVLKTMPNFKENIPEQSFNNDIMYTNDLKKVLGVYYFILYLSYLF